MNTWVLEIRYKNITTHHIIFGKFDNEYLIELVEKIMNVVCIDYEAKDNVAFIYTQDGYAIKATFELIHSFSFAYSADDQIYFQELKNKIKAETFAETLHYLIAIRQE